jgi:hypothetical protein
MSHQLATKLEKVDEEMCRLVIIESGMRLRKDEKRKREEISVSELWVYYYYYYYYYYYHHHIFISVCRILLVKLNIGLLWLKLHSTRRGLFLLAHWTWN